MTQREEEITQAAKEIARKWYHDPNNETAYIAARQGMLWADEHPSIDTVKKIICFALKHTNIIVADDLENAVDWELLIKKSMEK